MTKDNSRSGSRNAAKTAKNAEFYALLHTLEEELGLYLDLDPDLLRGKTILLPADDPESSNFTKYFVLNQHILGWDRLVSTSFNAEGRGKVLDVRADRMSEARVELLYGNGDFASEEVTRFRDEADFVFTNPPFSLFRKFWAWLFDVVDLCDGSVQTRSLSTDGGFYLRVNTPPVGRSLYRVGDDKPVYTYKRVSIRRKR